MSDDYLIYIGVILIILGLIFWKDAKSEIVWGELKDNSAFTCQSGKRIYPVIEFCMILRERR